MRIAVSSTFAFASVVVAGMAMPHFALADDTKPTADAAYAEMEKRFGGVPSFMKSFPRDGIAGAWAEYRDIELSDKTALDIKTKELIGLAVAAQIPCTYCVYAHTKGAQNAGATDQEIQEAVAMAALTRHWSTVLNGMQIDLDAFKQEMSGK